MLTLTKSRKNSIFFFIFHLMKVLPNYENKNDSINAIIANNVQRLSNMFSTYNSKLMFVTVSTNSCFICNLS